MMFGSELASGFVGLIVLVALTLAWLTVRAGSAPRLQRWSRHLHVICVLSWILAFWFLGGRFVVAETANETVARGVLAALLVIVALPILHDIFSGLALAIEGRHRIGHDVRVDDREGRIISLGLRCVLLRNSDGIETTIANRRFAAAEIVRLDLGQQDAPCRFEVAVPRDFDLESGTKRLLEAAMLSPYAAPGRKPDVLVVADRRGDVRLRVQGFVFDRAHEERYRGDVLLRAGLIGKAAAV
jgi:small-conductance mechanosensitive channel